MSRLSTPRAPPSFASLVQSFFTEHLTQQRAMSPRTVATYRDGFVLFLDFATVQLRQQPTTMRLQDITATLILAFLDHLERDRGNVVRTRNARLAALRAFLKFAGHRDVEAPHVVERVDRDAHPAYFAGRQRMIRVVAHLRGQIERDAEARHALIEQVAVARVRFGRRAEARILPHRPQPAAIHVGLDAAGIGEGAGRFLGHGCAGLQILRAHEMTGHRPHSSATGITAISVMTEPSMRVFENASVIAVSNAGLSFDTPYDHVYNCGSFRQELSLVPLMFWFFPSRTGDLLHEENGGLRLDSTSVAQPGGYWRSAWTRA